MRLGWIERECKLSLLRQCELVGVSRATVYRPREAPRTDEDDLTLCALIDEEYTRHPFYGSWRRVRQDSGGSRTSGKCKQCSGAWGSAQTPPCRESAAITATVVGVEN